MTTISEQIEAKLVSDPQSLTWQEVDQLSKTGPSAIPLLERIVVADVNFFTLRGATTALGKLLPDEAAIQSLIRLMTVNLTCTSHRETIRDEAIQALIYSRDGELVVRLHILWEFCMDQLAAGFPKLSISKASVLVLTLGEYRDKRATPLLLEYLPFWADLGETRDVFGFERRALSTIRDLSDPIAVLDLERYLDSQTGTVGFIKGHIPGNNFGLEEIWGSFVATINALATCGVTRHGLDILQQFRRSQNEHVSSAIREFDASMQQQKVTIYQAQELATMHKKAMTAFGQTLWGKQITAAKLRSKPQPQRQPQRQLAR